MECLGHVQNGNIIFDPPVVLPEGAKVRVVVDVSLPAAEDPVSTLYDRLQHLDGALTDLPADFAAEHDHYVGGAAKRDG
ncbi:MAG: hypothetical protein AB7G28_16320 [Pirellulales bacterium]